MGTERQRGRPFDTETARKAGAKSRKNGPHLSTILQKALNARIDENSPRMAQVAEAARELGYISKRGKVKVSDVVIAALVRAAISGEDWAVKLAFNYIDGLPTQKLEHTGESGGPIAMEYKFRVVSSREEWKEIEKAKAKAEEQE